MQEINIRHEGTAHQIFICEENVNEGKVVSNNIKFLAYVKLNKKVG
jgi:hypothetical protein